MVGLDLDVAILGVINTRVSTSSKYPHLQTLRGLGLIAKTTRIIMQYDMCLVVHKNIFWS